MNIHDFLTPPLEAMKREGPHDRIVLSSRVRLARNLTDFSFPGWAKKAERVQALEVIRPQVEGLKPMKEAFSESMDQCASRSPSAAVAASSRNSPAPSNS